MRTFTLPTVRNELDVRRTPDLVQQWTSALAYVTDPELRLRAALSMALPLANARHAIVFDEDRVLAGVPGTAAGSGGQRLFARARRVLEEELIAPDVYVARIAPDRGERLALRWESASPGAIEVARAILASCACALDQRAPAFAAPAGLPGLAETLRRLRQLIHDARRMRRTFAVVYLAVEAPETLAVPGTREALARRLRREVRANDHLGYAGDDAFVAVVGLDSGEAEAYPAAQRLVAAAAAVRVCGNAGVAICPEDGVEAEDLVERAGAAAMAAASAGDVAPHWYRDAAGRALARRAAIRAQLCEDDPGRLLEVRYQPIVDLKSGAVCAASAVLGWRGAPPADLSPHALLSGETDRRTRERLEAWTIDRAAEAYRAPDGLAAAIPVHLVLEARSDAVLDAIARGFGGRNNGKAAWVEIAGDDGAAPGGLEAFVRRLHALGAGVGTSAWRAGGAPFDAANGLLDFVTVDAGNDVRTLAGLALASVVAPLVLASGTRDRDHARWLARNGATAALGDGVAEPMALNMLVQWASDHSSAVAP